MVAPTSGRHSTMRGVMSGKYPCSSPRKELAPASHAKSPTGAARREYAPVPSPSRSPMNGGSVPPQMKATYPPPAGLPRAKDHKPGHAGFSSRSSPRPVTPNHHSAQAAAGHGFSKAGRSYGIPAPSSTPTRTPPPPAPQTARTHHSSRGGYSSNCPLSPLSPHSPQDREKHMRRQREIDSHHHQQQQQQQQQQLQQQQLQQASRQHVPTRAQQTSVSAKKTAIVPPPCLPPPCLPPYAEGKPAAGYPLQDEPTTSPVTSCAPGQTDWGTLSSFSFGAPPSPRSSVAIATNAPRLGVPVRSPEDESTDEEVMNRFVCMANRIAKVTPAKQADDILPHVSASDVVRQIVRRVNGFTDTGAARRVESYRTVYSSFERAICTIFKSPVGKLVRASALVDLMGCLFDMLLAPEYCKPWVSVAELQELKRTIVAGCDSSAAFAALVLMLRQQCAQVHNVQSVDQTAVSICIKELLPVATQAAREHAADIHIVLKELYRFTDSHDSHWAAMKRLYSLSDDPLYPAPSPLGAVSRIVSTLHNIVGHQSLMQAIAELNLPQQCRLELLVEKAALDTSLGSSQQSATSYNTALSTPRSPIGEDKLMQTVTSLSHSNSPVYNRC
ncbi:hypothetical protein DIPPA_34386 [Diplonema papillatum]|nr:hypothetical protein DIPPA_34386 [Diplonema papillatum]